MELAIDLRTLAFVLVLVVAATLGTLFMWPRKSVIKWGVLWATITTLAFLINSFTLFIAVTGFLVAWLTFRARQQALQYYFLFLPVVPAGLAATISGPTANVNALFQLSYPLAITFFVLIPITAKLLLHQGFLRILALPSDKYVIAFFLLASGLMFLREPSITHAMRGSFMLFFETVFPYVIISRACRTPNDLKMLLSVVLFTGIVVAFFGVFEEFKGWRLFSQLDEFLGINSVGDRGTYLHRSDLLRVTATFDTPTRFGFFLMIVVGVTLTLRRMDRGVRRFFLPLLGLVAITLFFTVSRGPWAASVALIFTYFALSGGKARFVTSLIAVIILAIVATTTIALFSNDLGVSSWSESGNTATLEYRLRLLEGGVSVIGQHPWLGSGDYLQTPEMEELRQGQGIIDLVNYYLAVALEYGLIGLLLFLGIFFSIMRGIFIYVWHAPRSDSMRVIGVGLFSILTGVGVALAGSSASGLNSFYTWAMLSLGASYLGILRQRAFRRRVDGPDLHRENSPAVKPAA